MRLFIVRKRGYRMFKDVLLPEKIGNYYLFQKRVLSFEINPVHIQATLISYKGSRVTIEKTQGLFLSDFSLASIESSIKKLSSSMKQYDEVVTSAFGTQVVFKELEVPFIGREKIAMIVGFEVEQYLPFSYHDAFVDFMILHEDTKDKKSRILVAATRKDDVTVLVEQFEKAQVSVNRVTVDLFSFYKVYQAALYKPNKKVAELFIDIGFDTSTVMYLHKGILEGTRVIPFGFATIAQKVSKVKNVAYYDVVQDLLQGNDTYQDTVSSELGALMGQVQMSLKFFEKSVTAYKAPHHVFLLGLGSCLSNVDKIMQDALSSVVKKVDLSSLIKGMSVKVSTKDPIELCYGMSLLGGLSIGCGNQSNFLFTQQEKSRSRLFLWQFILLCILTFGGLGSLYFNIHTRVSGLKSTYNASRRDLVNTIEQTMNVKMKNKKSLGAITKFAEDTMKKEKELWFLFSQQSENIFLEYLQQLSTVVDRQSLGLELTKVELGYDTVVLDGSVTGFEELSTLQEEVGMVTMFTITEKPKDISNFSITLKVNRQDES